jgi:hypothetical protein
MESSSNNEWYLFRLSTKSDEFEQPHRRKAQAFAEPSLPEERMLLRPLQPRDGLEAPYTRAMVDSHRGLVEVLHREHEDTHPDGQTEEAKA